METVHEWIQCSVKSIIALREWTFYEGVETAGILKSFADSNGFRIIYDLQFCYFDENWYNFIQGYVFISGRSCVYTYRRLILEGMHLPLSYIPTLRDTLHQRYGGVNINLVELNVDDRKEVLPHVWTCTSLLKISRTNEFIGIIIYKNSFQQSSK